MINSFWMLGMHASEPKTGGRVKDVHFSEDTITLTWQMDHEKIY
jgi:hypothetical protein